MRQISKKLKQRDTKVTQLKQHAATDNSRSSSVLRSATFITNLHTLKHTPPIACTHTQAHTLSHHTQVLPHCETGSATLKNCVLSDSSNSSNSNKELIYEKGFCKTATFYPSPTFRVSGFLLATPIGLEVAGSNPALLATPLTHLAAEALRKH